MSILTSPLWFSLASPIMNWANSRAEMLSSPSLLTGLRNASTISPCNNNNNNNRNSCNAEIKKNLPQLFLLPFPGLDVTVGVATVYSHAPSVTFRILIRILHFRHKMAAPPNSQDILSLPPNLPPTGLAYLAGIIHIFFKFQTTWRKFPTDASSSRHDVNSTHAAATRCHTTVTWCVCHSHN